ncbi:MAG: carboxypeptidase-like regulatory domain-containing protein [Methanospirillum sp.]|nr:carboxypeptidase-like regulatory domain-containing protein [Methanospirillum sp.]
MHTSAVSLLGVLLIFFAGCLVSASSVTIVVFEQSDKTSLIPEAIIYSDGTIAGKTDISGAYNLSYEGSPPLIRVAKGGYSDWTGSPSVNDTALLVPLQIRNSTLNVEVYDADSLLPIGFSFISVTGEDGSEQASQCGPDGKGTVTLRTDQVYKVKVSAQNFQPAYDTVVTSQDNTTAQYSLVRNDRISIRIADAIAGYPIPAATLVVDNRTAGGTNDRGVLVTNMTRNMEHSFDVSAEGYDPVHLVRMVALDDQVIDIPLNKAKSTVFVSVYDSKHQPVSGAEVSVDHQLKGRTNEFGRLMVPSLEIKPYEYSVVREGYKPSSLESTPQSASGEVIIVLESENRDLIVSVRDDKNTPMKDVSVTVFSNGSAIQDPVNTDGNGSALFSVNPSLSYQVLAEKGGYYPNNTMIPGETDTFTIVIHKPEGESMASPGDFPWLPLGIILVLIIAGAGYFVLSGKRRPRKKRRNSRRGSL